MPRKITFETVRKLAADLPGVEDGTSYGSPCIKIDGQLLTCIAINKSAEPNSLVIRIDFDQRDALIAEAPETYYITDHYVDYPSVLVRLSRVNENAIRDLLQAGWKFLTSKRRHPRRKHEFT